MNETVLTQNPDCQGGGMFTISPRASTVFGAVSKARPSVRAGLEKEKSRPEKELTFLRDWLLLI
jgi:hypothetical protein